jgi:hypothetical protein
MQKRYLASLARQDPRPRAGVAAAAPLPCRGLAKASAREPALPLPPCCSLAPPGDAALLEDARSWCWVLLAAGSSAPSSSHFPSINLGSTFFGEEGRGRQEHRSAAWES